MVQELIDKYNLDKFKITGCALGLIDEKGTPIRKGWTIATNEKYLVEGFRGKICPGKHVHPEHRKVEGKYTKETERYTDEMVHIIHKSWKKASKMRNFNPKPSKDQKEHNRIRWGDIPSMPVR